MATKNTSLRQAKHAKRNKRAKQKQVTARKEEARGKQLIGRREMAKLMDSVQSNDDIIVQAKDTLKKLRKKYRDGKISRDEFEEKTAFQPEEVITNKDVMQNISQVIPAAVRVHAGVEVLEILAGEKRFELSDDDLVLIKLLDQQLTSLVEDINAVTIFVEDEKVPSDYMEVFMHYTELVARIFEVTVPGVMLLLNAHDAAIDQYAHEHRDTNLPVYNYMLRLHEERMTRVAPMYRTTETVIAEPVHEYTPANPMPSDPVIDDDIEDAVLGDTPDLERDVLAEQSPT